MKPNQITLIALAAIALTFSGCLMPYESDYSCDYSRGYGKCLGARDNYELSQMSEQERSQALNKNKLNAQPTTKQGKTTASDSLSYEALRDSRNGDLNELEKFGCLTPLEQTALKNNEALTYIERLLLDRKAINDRTPITQTDKAIIADFAIFNEVSDRAGSDNADNSGNNDRRSGSNAKSATTCDYPTIERGDHVEVLAYRAWLRTAPDASYPAKDGLEAKRGDIFTASNSQCGWVKLDNGRYIHQSIVSVVPAAQSAYETNDEEIE
jgi:hypothetical protein